jgi:2-succinyl-6-hydroxy-2,4-cyclohexadiene-1-carboxylate synthase
VGYSLGGRLLLHTAKKYPNLMSGLVIISSHFGLQREGQKKDRVAHDHRWAERLRKGSFQEFLSRWYEQDLFRSFVKLPFFSGTLLQKLATHNPFFLADMLEATSLGRQDFLEDVFLSFKDRALYLAGEKDYRYFTLAEKLKKKVPKDGVCIIPNARHVLHLEAPRLVSAAVYDFLMRT